MTSRSGASHTRRRISATLAAAPLIAAAFGLLGLHAPAQAEAFPSRPIRFIVPFPPGSGTDTTARIFAKKIGDISGQSVAVENKPGGNGIIGVQTVLNAPADGYTVFIGSNSTLSTNAATIRKLPYDPLTDFAPITLLNRGPALVIVPPGSPYKTLSDLIADARTRPGALNYASGSMSYTLYSEWLNELTRMKTTGINTKGAGEAVNMTLAGTVDFAVVDASGSVELVKSGRLRALAYAGPQRSPLLPNTPTSAEAGVPEFLAYNWVAAAASAKTPPDILQQLHALFTKAGATKEVQEHYARQSNALLMSTPAELRDYQKTEIARWKQLAATVGLEPQ